MAPSTTPGAVTSPPDPAEDETQTGETVQRRHQRRRWAQLLRRVYEVDPLTCRQCGAPMRVVAFIQEPAAIRKILTHLEHYGAHRHPSRDPAPRPYDTHALCFLRRLLPLPLLPACGRGSRPAPAPLSDSAPLALTRASRNPAALHLCPSPVSETPTPPLHRAPSGATPLLYARVDLVPLADGTPAVLEVELCEPSLFLAHAEGAAERFAAAIVSRLPPSGR